MDENKKKALRAGVIIFIVLLVLSAVEFFVGLSFPTLWGVLLGIAAVKAFFVIRDYMHIGRVFSSDEVHE